MRRALVAALVALTAAAPLAGQPRRAGTVLLFVSAGCPISNRYAPEIARLAREFAPRGVSFRLIYPNPLDDDAAVAAHLAAYDLPLAAERDPRHQWVRQTGATITPEAAVLDGDGRLVYRGRIDDRFVALGIERPAATRRDLFEVLTALASGTAVARRDTQAVGCFIADMR